MLEVICLNVWTLIAIIEAVFSYFCIALGFVCQKKGIDWLGYQGPKDNRYFCNLKLWFSGLSLLILGGIPNYLALKVLNVHLIDAISGLNIVFMVFLSRLILKEILFVLDYVYSVILCAAAIILIYLVDRSAGLNIKAEYAYLAADIPMGLFLVWGVLRVAKLIKRGSRLQAIFLAALGGGMSGLLAIYMKILQMEWGAQIFSYPFSPYFYCLLIVSLLSQVALQISYKMESMILVGPAQYATTVFYSVLAAYPVFQLPIRPLQIICFIVIITSVVLMVHGHSIQKN